jgi:hypothetical protein
MALPASADAMGPLARNRHAPSNIAMIRFLLGEPPRLWHVAAAKICGRQAAS